MNKIKSNQLLSSTPSLLYLSICAVLFVPASLLPAPSLAQSLPPGFAPQPASSVTNNNSVNTNNNVNINAQPFISPSPSPKATPVVNVAPSQTQSSSLSSLPIVTNLMPEQIFSIFEQEVKLTLTDPLHRQQFIDLAASSVREKNFDKSQYILIVDRNTKRQVASLGFYNFEKKTLDISSFTLVATGAVKKGKFITPLGWFEHVVSNGSYRAEGSKNENGIRGYGKKGMRVWDLGWHNAQASWVKEERIMPIRFQLHATDPDFLEPKLGTPGSQGCVRMSSSLNQFLDKYGILDANFEAVNYWALRRDRMPAQMAGSFTLVIETPAVQFASPATSTTPVIATK